jgi:hypothetical protein
VLPENGVVFNDNVVPRIDLKIHPDSLTKLLVSESKYEDHTFQADFFWNDGIKKDTILQIGLRLRGNTSRSSSKKSFKVEFNHFGSRKFHGLSDLNLNGEHNDPSIIRSKLSWDIMKLAGVEGSRSNHIALYINNEYHGLYVNVEHIDNDYFKVRGKDPDGQLFKCFYGADFVFRGNNPNNYSTDVYQAQNNLAEPDYYALMEFTRALQDVSNPDFRCNLEKIFDVDTYLRRMALEILIGHWDNPIFNKNNAYLYHNPVSGKFELMTYDIDNTYGIDWVGINWAERNIYTWSYPIDPRPIYTNLLNIPEYKIRFGYYIKKFVDEFFNPAFLNSYIDNIKNKISPYRINDVFASLDYGYTYADFLQSYDKPLGAHVKTGLKEYIASRSSSAKSQLQNTNISPVIEQQKVSWTDTSCRLTSKISGLSQVSATGYYKLNNGQWHNITLYDNGIYPDPKAGDGIFTFEFSYSGMVPAEIYISAKDVTGRSSRWPVCDFYTINLGYQDVPKLVVNEFMADNTIIKDNAGEFDDWIEIYNAGTTLVFLGDKYLSDNPSKPDKWQLPFVDLEPGQFLLIWADEDKEQGDNHTNFKLSKSGEFIGIFDSKENNFAPIDTFSFGPANTNKSYGRYPDGKGSVILLPGVTPGFSNVLSTESTPTILEIVISPNPFSDLISIKNLLATDKVNLYDIYGNNIVHPVSIINHELIDCSNLDTGFYILQINRANHFIRKKIIKI